MIRSFAYLLLSAYTGARFCTRRDAWGALWTCLGIALGVTVVAMFV